MDLHNYQEWIAERQRLLERIKELEAENAELKKRLGEDVVPVVHEPTAMHKLSAQEKVELFRSVFKGREDVFAEKTVISPSSLCNAAHVEILAKLLKPHCPNVITLVGSESTKEKRQKMEYLQSIPSTEPLVIIATGKYVGEGFVYARLDTLFLVSPVAWKGIVAQYAGRLHR